MLFTYVFFIYTLMTVLATLEKTVKAGLSVWKFCEGSEGYYAENNAGKHVDCSDLNDLRNFYRKMLTYGFRTPSETAGPAD